MTQRMVVTIPVRRFASQEAFNLMVQTAHNAGVLVTTRSEYRFFGTRKSLVLSATRGDMHAMHFFRLVNERLG